MGPMTRRKRSTTSPVLRTREPLLILGDPECVTRAEGPKSSIGMGHQACSPPFCAPCTLLGDGMPPRSDTVAAPTSVSTWVRRRSSIEISPASNTREAHLRNARQ